MPWTHFTSYLSAGENLTIAQRAELYDALDERFKAVDLSWGVYTGASMVALRDTPLAHRRVIYVTGGSPITSTIGGVLDLLAGYFYRTAKVETDTGPETYDEGELFDEAAALLGLSGFGSNLLDVRDDWNVLRQAILLLKWLKITTPSGGSGYYKGSAEYADFETAKTSYEAAGETSTASRAWARLNGAAGPPLTSPVYAFDASRTNPTTTIPAGWFGGWTLAIAPTWALGDEGYEYAEVAGEVLVDEETFVVGPGPLGRGPWEVQTTTLTVVGTVGFETRPLGYLDGTFADVMDAALPFVEISPGSDTLVKKGSMQFTAIYAGALEFDFD